MTKDPSQLRANLKALKNLSGYVMLSSGSYFLIVGFTGLFFIGQPLAFYVNSPLLKGIYVIHTFTRIK